MALYLRGTLDAFVNKAQLESGDVWCGTTRRLKEHIAASVQCFDKKKLIRGLLTTNPHTPDKVQELALWILDGTYSTADVAALTPSYAHGLLATLVATATCTSYMADKDDTPLFDGLTASDLEKSVTDVVDKWETFTCEIEWASSEERVSFGEELVDAVSSLALFAWRNGAD